MCRKLYDPQEDTETSTVQKLYSIPVAASSTIRKRILKLVWMWGLFLYFRRRKLYDPQEDTETLYMGLFLVGLSNRKLYDPQEDTETVSVTSTATVTATASSTIRKRILKRWVVRIEAITDAPQALRSARGY